MEKKSRTTLEPSDAAKQGSLVGEFFAMVKENKRYWLIPIIVVLLVLGVLVMLGSTAVAPFIYTLF